MHLLSNATGAQLGDYPSDFFYDHMPVRIAIDRFRSHLDDLSRNIETRNATLDMPYTYLDPATVSASVNV